MAVLRFPLQIASPAVRYEIIIHEGLELQFMLTCSSLCETFQYTASICRYAQQVRRFLQ